MLNTHCHHEVKMSSGVRRLYLHKLGRGGGQVSGQCPKVQCCFTSTETVRTAGDGEPSGPPPFPHSF